MRLLAFLLLITLFGGISLPAFAAKYHCIFYTEADQTPVCLLETTDAKSRCEHKFGDVTATCSGLEQRQILCIFHNGPVEWNTLRTAKNGSLLMQPGIIAGGTSTTDASMLNVGYNETQNHYIEAFCVLNPRRK
jgi:hypothetical protein